MTSISTMQNPSCLLYGAGDCRYEDRPIPTIEDPNDVIIRIAYTGVCGSDVSFWLHGGIKRPITPSNPVVMGHEASGTVHAVGVAVQHLQPGDPVAIEPGYPCRRCTLCKAGRYNLCPGMKFAAVPSSCDGTLARFFRIPADYCHLLRSRVQESCSGGGVGVGLGLDEAVLMEPLAVAVHSVRSVGVTPGSRVVVFGAGTVGLLSASVAREFGATQIVMVDVNAAKLEFAASVVPNTNGSVSFGTYIPSSTLSAEENAHQLLEKFDSLNNRPGDCDGLIIPGFDIAIEATGAEPCVQMGIQVLRAGGSYIQTGNGKRSVDFPIATVAEKEITVKGCFRYGPGDFQLGVRMASEGRIPVKRFITKVVPFERAVEAWETTRRGEGIKTLIRGVDG